MRLLCSRAPTLASASWSVAPSPMRAWRLTTATVAGVEVLLRGERQRRASARGGPRWSPPQRLGALPRGASASRWTSRIDACARRAPMEMTVRDTSAAAGVPRSQRSTMGAARRTPSGTWRWSPAWRPRAPPARARRPRGATRRPRWPRGHRPASRSASSKVPRKMPAVAATGPTARCHDAFSRSRGRPRPLREVRPSLPGATAARGVDRTPRRRRRRSR